MEKRNTIQKQLVLEAVAQLHNHPTAEQVYAQVVKAHPTISKATVYRNLAMFKESGTIQSIGVVGGLERYDAHVNPHAHFICTCCGKVEDLPMAALAPALLEDAGRLAEATVTGYQLQFTGLCSGCNKKSEPKN